MGGGGGFKASSSCECKAIERAKVIRKWSESGNKPTKEQNRPCSLKLCILVNAAVSFSFVEVEKTRQQQIRNTSFLPF